MIATARGVAPLLERGAWVAPEAKWLAILGLYDLVFALVAYAVFDPLLED